VNHEKEKTMSLRSGLSQLLWKEGRPSPAEPILAAPREVTGMAAVWQKAARCALAGLAATMLTAQVVGVHLVAPVDAASNFRACCQQAHDADLDCFDNCNQDQINNLAKCDRQQTRCNNGCFNSYQPGSDQRQICLDQCASSRTSCRQRANNRSDECITDCESNEEIIEASCEAQFNKPSGQCDVLLGNP
jgi:hypothetical protein